MKHTSSMPRAMCERKRRTLCLVASTRDCPLERLLGDFPRFQWNESGCQVFSPTAKGLVFS